MAKKKSSTPSVQLPLERLEQKILLIRVQPPLCFSGGGVIAAGGGGWAGAAFPEVAERVGFAEVVGGQLQQRLGALVPELFAPFDAAVDLLNCRFDVTGGDRQALLPIGGVLHSRRLVREIPQRVGDDPPRRRVRLILRRRAQFVRSRRQRREQRLDVSFPQVLCPQAILGPPRGGRAAGHRGGVDIADRVGEIEDWRVVREVLLVDAPVGGRAGGP